MIGYTNGDYVVYGGARPDERLGYDSHLRTEDVLGVMLHPARFRVYLPEFLVRLAGDFAVLIEEYCP